MPSIDLPADLHFEDDDGSNLARLSDATDIARVKPGAVLIAGEPYAWTPAEVLSIDDGWVRFRPLPDGRGPASVPPAAAQH